jgi:NAD+ synthase (glutamine-hydrolysing)
MILNISASPFNIGKLEQRYDILCGCAKHFGCAMGYCNLVGGQDELVFDGRSMILDRQGCVVGQGKHFAEDMVIGDVFSDDGGGLRVRNIKADVEYPRPEVTDIEQEIYQALVLGTKDYVTKNNFKKVLIGMSGGIDSSLTAAVAVDALGAENVVGVTMPSKYNSSETINDAEKCAINLGIEFHTIAIEDVLMSFNKTLFAMPDWSDSGVAYENLQARIRGTILMSLSNQYGYLVLTAGNKSESAVGYTTLYGDTAGGFSVIKDVPKTLVYRLSRYLNKEKGRDVIPESVILREPSAELRADQKDTDSLPDYDKLDAVLKGYVEDDLSAKQLLDKGIDRELVSKVIRMVDLNEYKRRQSPPGVRITPKAFGKDRRMPITNRYQDK